MKVLLIEDNPGDETLVRHQLSSGAGPGVAVASRDTLAGGLAALQADDFDAVLLDLSLPDSRGLDTLTRLVLLREDVAVVVLTGYDDEETALRALKAGAQDYLVKGHHDAALLRRVLRHATERKRLETQLRQLNADLESRVERRTRELAQANRELEAFAFSVSHDLQAPLRTIGGFAEILATDFGDELCAEAAHYMRRMRDATRHMSDLLGALLELSQVSRYVMQLQELDLAKLALGLVRELGADNPDRTVEFASEGNLRVEGDPRLMEIALRNLLDNAWKFTRPRAPARITLRGVEELGRRRIELADNGVGFDPIYARRLFEPFQRLHRSDEFEGTGIGLATVQRIIHRHGGRIWAESTPGSGAVFIFTVVESVPTPLPRSHLE